MSCDLDMFVKKRDGNSEILSYKKILDRSKKIGEKFENNVNHTLLVTKVMDQLYNNIKTSEIDELLCQQCASMSSIDYDYYTLGSYICISNHQKEHHLVFLLAHSEYPPPLIHHHQILMHEPQETNFLLLLDLHF